MGEIVYRINAADSDALGKVRCIDGLQAAREGNFIWLRGIPDTPSPDSRLTGLPVMNTFFVDEHNLLFNQGGLTPVDTLKPMNWQPLPLFLQVEWPASAMPARAGEQVKIRLIPSEKIREGYALTTTLEACKNYGETAPAARLDLLRFAVSEGNEVLIMGKLLPPLPGKEYWLSNDILLPCGYDFEIPLVASFLSEKWNAAKDSILVFDEQGKGRKIDKTNFVDAKRSTIRLTIASNKGIGNRQTNG